jgi:CheY-like chemotaxis protein
MQPYRVLVVDDHPDTAEVLSVLFQMMGHETHCALRGRDALRIARELDPDVILLDIGLPDITGYDVLRTLRADTTRPSRFIAAVTGHGRPADVARAVTAGFDQHITKPVDMIKIRQVLLCADSFYAQVPPRGQPAEWHEGSAG